LLALLAIGLGAMGAHAFEKIPEVTPKDVANWKTAALYHLVHAVALVFLAGRGPKVVWWLIFSGVILFSGSLYALALGAPRLVGVITPLGGLAFIVGWVALAFGLRAAR
jgi:uncharacterized membrane protein YgdD (TMEM256/DUF423 family)